ncbi:type II CAAX prenyl endopeptidase Rce1 family protein [Kouleothrix sp.]|uniref:CPBP family glutamic-type intramembrane protease n=1 Tax=Kouleothrix sp. TaxID=2779161 RepID=UPI00391DA32A
MSTIATVAPRAAGIAPRRWMAAHPLLAYFLIAFGVVWLALLPVVLSRNGLGILPFGISDGLFVVLFIGSTLLGPTGGAFAVTAAAEGRAGVGRLLRRYVQWRVGPQWYAIALFGYIALHLVAAGALLGAGPLLAMLAQWPLLLSSYLPALLMMIIFPALLEEPGWRGFALPRLQARYGPLAGTLMLGVLHGLWHLPVYTFVSGPAAMGPFSIGHVASNTLFIVLLTVIWAWVFNNASGSILIAILLHAASNATGNFFSALLPTPLPASFASEFQLLMFGLYFAAALAIVLATRGRLGYTGARQSPAAVVE